MAQAVARDGRPRKRAVLVALIALVIVAGLASRRFDVLPKFLGKYPGDSLWALMVFFGWSFLRPRASTLTLTIFGFGTACLVEFSQLYQAPWIHALRATTVGHLVLGSVFSWWDLCAYAIGVGIGSALDHLLFSTGNHPP